MQKGLTATECMILRAFRTSAQLDVIATNLGMSVMTVKTHLRSVRSKRDIRTLDELRERLLAGEFDAVISELSC